MSKVLGSGETTSEQALKTMGDAGLGMISAWHYDYKSPNPAPGHGDIRHLNCGAVRGGVSRSGVGGAKGVDQGECGLAKHALDSAPGSRVTGAGTHTATPCRLDPRWEKLWGGRRRLWHLHRPYVPMEVPRGPNQ